MISGRSFLVVPQVIPFTMQRNNVGISYNGLVHTVTTTDQWIQLVCDFRKEEEVHRTGWSGEVHNV